MPRLFVAVWPTPDVVATLVELCREESGVRYLPRETWHVTLRFLGEADGDAAVAALDGGQYRPATARLGPTVGVIARSAIAVPVHGLERLAAEVSMRTAELGEPPRPTFRGHLTIARLKSNAVRSTLRGRRIEARFDVTQIALVRSSLDHRGARYDTIASWNVTDAC